MFGLGAWELLVILAIILVLFGAKKVPELARSLGQGAKEIRKGFDEGDEPTGDDRAKQSEAKAESSIDSDQEGKDSTKV